MIGANARARRIDERRAKEFPAEALKRPATRIATAILMYSFGGKRREGVTETEVLPPGIEGSGIGIDPVSVGGRPLQTTLNEKKEARIHERVIELLTLVQPRVFDKLTPTKVVELFKLGEGTPPTPWALVQLVLSTDSTRSSGELSVGCVA